MCSRKLNRKSCLRRAHIIVGRKVNKQGKYMDCQSVVSVVEKENVGNGEQRMPAWERVGALEKAL